MKKALLPDAGTDLRQRRNIVSLREMLMEMERVIVKKSKEREMERERDEEERDKEDSEKGDEKEEGEEPGDGGATEDEDEDADEHAVVDEDESQQPINKGCTKRIWSDSHELVFLEFLLEYKKKNGKIPSKRNYSTMFSTFTRPIGFTPTEVQLGTKIRTFKEKFMDKLKKGPDAVKSPHDKMVYQMCMELFGVPSKKGKKKEEASGLGMVEANGVRFPLYLQQLIGDVIKSPDVMMALMEESVLNDFEAKAKMLNIEALKLRAKQDELRVKEDELRAKFLTLLVASMEQNQRDEESKAGEAVSMADVQELCSNASDGRGCRLEDA